MSEEILTFILEGMAEDEERCKEMGFDDYDQFLEQQGSCLEGLTDRDLRHLKYFAKEIREDHFKVMDKEAMIPLSVSGFCYDPEGHLVFYYE